MPLRRRMSAALTRAVEGLRAEVRHARDAGRLRLPPVRTLAHRLGIGQETVMKAAGLVEQEGLIKRVERAGLMVVSAPGQVVAAGVEWDMREHETTPYDRLLSDLMTGHYPPSTPIPSYKLLSQRYGASYPTLRTAVDDLTKRGMLERIGRRHVVRSHTADRGASQIVLVRWMAALHTGPFSAGTVARQLEERCTQRHIRLVQFRYGADADNRGARRQGFERMLEEARQKPTLGYILWCNAPWPDEVAAMLERLTATRKPVCHIDETGELYAGGEPRRAGRPHRCAWFPFRIGAAPGRDIGAYLLGLGHERIAWISHDPATQWSRNRLLGLRTAFERSTIRGEVVAVESAETRGPSAEQQEKLRLMYETGLALARAVNGGSPIQNESLFTWIIGTISGTDVEHDRFFAHLLERAAANRRLTAWVCANDELARAALRFLRNRNIAVPERLSVIGFDNSLEAQTDGLTSYGFNETGLVHAVLNHICEPAIARGKGAVCVTVPGVLVERGSTGRPFR